MTTLQRALESGAPMSRLHERQSYDPADFPVPTGREEEWRFTPLRRLRRPQGDTVLPSARSPWKPVPHPRSLPLVPNGDIAGARASFIAFPYGAAARRAFLVVVLARSAAALAQAPSVSEWAPLNFFGLRDGGCPLQSPAP